MPQDNSSIVCPECYFDTVFGCTEAEIIEEHRQAQARNCVSRLQEAYNKAHDIRKFEIDLYWKRAAYFWVFEALLFVAYGSCLQSICKQEAITPYIQFGLPLLAGGGIILTILWISSMLGSKFWQKNWELHIDQLENAISGHLHKTVCFKSGGNMCYYSTDDKTSANNHFSVSNINLCVGLLVMCSWLMMFFIALVVLSNEYPNHYWVLSLYLIVLFLLIYGFRKHTYSGSKISYRLNRLLGIPHNMS